MKLLAIFLISIPSVLFAQEQTKQIEGDSTEFQHQIPLNPNHVDEEGRKTGKWTILFDENFNETDSLENTHFYRLITYKEGQPVGKMADYYRSGQIQMQATMISDAPDTYDGVVIYYSEEGYIENYQFFNNGQLDNNETILSLSVIVEDQRKNGEKGDDYIYLLNTFARTYIRLKLYENAKSFSGVCCFVMSLFENPTHFIPCILIF